MINGELQREIDLLAKKLYAISDNAKKESQDAFKQAAPLLISAIQARAPQSDAPHFRYKDGKIAATYKPGNLKRSFKTLVFRKSAAVFVGPKVDKRGSGGTFAGSRVDGYYAHWVEFGAPEIGLQPQPFVRPAAASAGPVVLRLATQILKRVIERKAKI